MLRQGSGGYSPHSSTVDVGNLEEGRNGVKGYRKPGLTNAMPLTKRQVVYVAVGLMLVMVLYLSFSSTAASSFRGSQRSSPTDAEYDADRAVYRIAIVTDLDHGSKDQGKDGKTFWKSFYRQATLTRDTSTGRYTAVFDDEASTGTLRSRLALDGRGMELSWLQRFNGKMYSGDDRSGVMYEIDGLGAKASAHARFVCPDGDGTEEKGFKSEWAAVKDDNLYIGSFGKEWSSDAGEFINNNPNWIKVIDKYGTVRSVDWTSRYNKLREASGYSFPSYLFHESGAWSDRLQKWVFVPRRASKERYNPDLDETKGTNLLFLTDSDFSNIEVRKIDVKLSEDGMNPKGFSEIKIVPGRDELFALRSMEYQGKTESWLTVLGLDGSVLMEDVRIGPYKFEGLEIL